MKPVLSWMAEIPEIVLRTAFQGNEIWRPKEIDLKMNRRLHIEKSLAQNMQLLLPKKTSKKT